MKGIILAGGQGTRLYPLTLITSKQLLPVYNKPMIYYPLATLMQAGIREVLIISSPRDLPNFQKLLGNGGHLGLSIEYAEQESPNGIAEALIIGEEFIGGDSVALILGDNIFYGENMGPLLTKLGKHQEGAVVFGYEVKDPHRYGVVEFDDEGRAKRILEKPEEPPSSYAVTGLYFYDSDAPRKAKQLTPSSRNELEITDLNSLYLQQRQLSVELLGRGFAWLDTGTHEALSSASQYVQMLQERQGIEIACLEEISWKKGWISDEAFAFLANAAPASSYGEYLRRQTEFVALLR
ncbi:MAG: glucose-1-phosphate thymidylyltransferase RfbA [Simkaniaceae bacterium]|nr:glucose-1-phosphate thymidylyltransferase RfbA [Simkaniaceae bacterium]